MKLGRRFNLWSALTSPRLYLPLSLPRSAALILALEKRRETVRGRGGVSFFSTDHRLRDRAMIGVMVYSFARALQRTSASGSTPLSRVNSRAQNSVRSQAAADRKRSPGERTVCGHRRRPTGNGHRVSGLRRVEIFSLPMETSRTATALVAEFLQRRS
jgi:hypothetical protein